MGFLFWRGESVKGQFQCQVFLLCKLSTNGHSWTNTEKSVSNVIKSEKVILVNVSFSCRFKSFEVS